MPAPVLPEICYLLQTRIGPAAEQAFVRALADGEFRIEPQEEEDLPRVADLVSIYQSLPLGFVDASLVAMAERLDITSVLTTDRRHFGVVRARHVERFRMVP